MHSKNVDKTLLTIVLILLAFGLIMIKTLTTGVVNIMSVASVRDGGVGLVLEPTEETGGRVV